MLRRRAFRLDARRPTVRKGLNFVVPVLRFLFLFNCWQFLQFGLCLVLCAMGKITYIALNDIFAVLEPQLNNNNRLYRSLMGLEDDTEESVPDAVTDIYLDIRDQCDGADRYDALLVVHTANHHFKQRQDYRDTYGNHEFTHPYKLKIVFFVGLSPDPEVMDRLRAENTQRADTVILDHVDSYHNLTYKAVGVFRWMAERCTGVKVVIKMDDDVLFDVHRFFEELWPPPSYLKHAVFCHVWTEPKVDREGKWKLPESLFPQRTFPNYCSGFFVVITPSLVHSFYQAARAARFLWIDDVFMYGLARLYLKHSQIVNSDQMAKWSFKHEECLARFGYRCKYIASVLGETRQFLPTILSLMALRHQELKRQADAKKFGTGIGAAGDAVLTGLEQGKAPVFPRSTIVANPKMRWKNGTLDIKRRLKTPQRNAVHN